MENVYYFKIEEKKRLALWEDHNVSPGESEKEENIFSILIAPLPPNHAGTTLITHLLLLIIPDIIGRRKKMQGHAIHWFISEDRNDFSKLIDTLGISPGAGRMVRGDRGKMPAPVTRTFIQWTHDGDISPDQNHGETSTHPVYRNQWFLKPGSLSQSIAHLIETGEMTFIPPGEKKKFLHLMAHMENWLISSFDTPGLPIPAYYCSDCRHLVMAEIEKETGKAPEKCTMCGSTRFQPEQTFMDSSFTGAFLPFSSSSTFSLTSASTGLNRHQLSQLLMIPLRLNKNKGNPFRDIIIHGRIRGEKGRKICGANKNIMDTGHLADTYGIDALRFILASRGSAGKDFSLSLHHLEGARNFINKTWNAARFVLIHCEQTSSAVPNIDFSNLGDPDKWILHSINNLVEKINESLENYRVNHAARMLYRFTRFEYCDWYIEFSKIDTKKPGTCQTLKWTLFLLLQLLHPFLPFITDTIYEKMKTKVPLSRGNSLDHTRFPSFDSRMVFIKEFSDIEVLKKVIKETRKIRTINRIDTRLPIKVFLKTDSEKEARAVTGNLKYFDFLARSSHTEVVDTFKHRPKGFKSSCLNWEILVPFDADDGHPAQRERIDNELKTLSESIEKIEQELSGISLSLEAPGPGPGISPGLKKKTQDLKKELQKKISQRDRTRKTIEGLS